MFVHEYAKPKDGDRFLWVRFGALGDALQDLANAFLVKRRFPHIKMSFMTTSQYVDIIQSQPFIENVICGQKRPHSLFWQTVSNIKNAEIDWICSTYQGGHMPLLAAASMVKNRLGNSRYFSFLDTGNVYSWCNAFGIDLYDRSEPFLMATGESLCFAKELLVSLPEKKIFTVIGASSVSKRWPMENWIEFITPLIEEGWGIVINGHGPQEEKIADAVEKSINSNNILNLVGKLNFTQMAAVAHLCTAAVGNDSGPMHIATLGGVPAVIISDYILPAEIGYLMPWVIPVTAFGLPRGKTLYTRQRSAATLRGITADKVLDGFEKLLSIKVPDRPSLLAAMK